MKKMNLSWLLVCVLLVGCCTLECVGPVDRNIKPYLHYWEKAGVTVEQRREDWLKCGGMSNGDYSIDIPSGSTTEAILKSDETKKKILGDCMAKKGYHYVP